MRREYNSVEVDIEFFNIPSNSYITTSEGGIDDGGDFEEEVEF